MHIVSVRSKQDNTSDSKAYALSMSIIKRWDDVYSFFSMYHYLTILAKAGLA